MHLTAVLIPAAEGRYIANNPEPGTTSQGETIEEALVSASVAATSSCDADRPDGSCRTTRN
jgi:predicted RNase H-like HicB family nuclease